jgi:hypothetical protein
MQDPRLKPPRPTRELRRWRWWSFIRSHHRALATMLILGLILATIIVAIIHAISGDLSNASTTLGCAILAAFCCFLFDTP